MKASYCDLGLMDYKSCWDLQEQLFEQMVLRKTKGRDKQLQKPLAAYIGHQPSPTEVSHADCATDGSVIDRGFAKIIDGDQTERGETGPNDDKLYDKSQDDIESQKGKVEKLSEKGQCETTANGSRIAAQPGARLTNENEQGNTPATYKETPDEAGTILLVEHPPVYTLGKSGHSENLLVGRSALEAMGAQFFHIDRGGDITFHGPGQLVCYPILDLEQLGIGLRDYIAALEEAVIRTVAHYGIKAGRIEGASGVWLGQGVDRGSWKSAQQNRIAGQEAPEATASRTSSQQIQSPAEGPLRKICAIGVRASRYITMHGFALNVSTDLGWFAKINPCGFTDRGVTSIERETGRKIEMDEVKNLVVEFLSEILNVKIYKK